MFLFNNYSRNELFQSSNSREYQETFLNQNSRNTTLFGKICYFIKNKFNSLYRVNYQYEIDKDYRYNEMIRTL